MAPPPPHQGGVLPAVALALLLLTVAARAQQEYEANKQDACYAANGSSVLGYTCNATSAPPPCDAFLVFRSYPPLYASPVSISYLLNSSVSAVAAANAVPTVSPLAAFSLVLAPVPCACTPGGYYQHNASYTIQFLGETYFIIANITYQGLTTCQALIAQNPRLDSRGLVSGHILTVPLRCACPSPAQAAAGVKHLLSYLVMWGDDVTAIAARFRVDAQAVLDANSLAKDDIIYPFTTLLIPLKAAPTADMLASPAPPPAPTPPQAPPAQSGGSGAGRWVAVGVGAGCGALALAAVLGLLFLRARRRRRRGNGESDRPRKVVIDVSASADYGALASGKQTTTTTTSSSSWWTSPLVASDVRGAVESLTVYKYSELEKATAGFSEERRVTGTSVYRAVINGDAAAVKRVSGDVSGEVGILNRVNHSCLVRLSGLCVHRGDTYLVFEFAENGALSDWLHGGGGGNTPRWRQRVQVAFDVSDGLNYLHNYTNPPCVHKNLKSSNVLLDADFRAKVSSFGLARAVTAADGGAQLTRHVVGTQGYLAPEYLEHGLITPKLDVFAFGVILLELLSGKEAAFADDGGNKGEEETLLWESAEERLVADGEDVDRVKVRAFMDPRLHGDYPLDLALAMAALALRCVAKEPRARPSMDEVFVSLSAVYNSTLDLDPSDYGNSGSSIVGR
ncbi:protein LYK5-like [Phragmites australis]|uniref:protein LYK5-like n=1 Tax=Phragmites australis TaxID=29695 RepID=UPI002D777EBB|nr:protein LYK5-like [Phragmites australis]